MFTSVSFLDTGGWGLLFSPTGIICTWLAPLQGSPAHMGTNHTILSAQCPIPGNLSFFGLRIATLFFPPNHPAEFLQTVKGIDSRTSATRPLKNLFMTRNLKAEGKENVWKKFVFFLRCTAILCLQPPYFTVRSSPSRCSMSVPQPFLALLTSLGVTW